MKRVLFALGILLCMLAACGRNDGDNLCDWQRLQLYVAADSVTPTGLQLTTINDSERYIGHGLQFHIEQYMGGTWKEPQIYNVSWKLPLLIVPPGSYREEDINWYHMYGPLPPGKYRIVRNIIQGNDDLTSLWQQYSPEKYLYAVFTIE